MPTQEERLGNVENDLKQFKSETLRAYRDMAMDLGMVKGLTLDATGRLINLTRQTEAFEDEVKQRFDAQERRFDALEGHLLSFEQNANSRFDTIDQRFDAMDSRFLAQDTHFETLEGRFNTLEGRFDTLEKKFDQMLLLLTTMLQPKPEQGA